ncbi:flagellar assembly protein FliW [Metabacillus niabensis]|uniref:Flagellar assembly factor FliW n=1 Tax=Metabacillus niabensis TaxID=324854 RepID=A0ABT9Z4F2_9BACI|nr:flagellar assembly protein FliW [Metabacillus niabensis]MDQ0227139.1 flagellar assembly factor FliW [Metabacillus niabensis]
MEIQTKYHGAIEVEQNEFIHFEQGIPGFLDEKEFVFLPLDDKGQLLIMQSTKTSELGFVVTNPFEFFKEYEFELSDQDKESLKVEKETDIQVFTILTVKEPFAETTANLLAPLVINIATKLAKQVILTDTPYTTKHKIIQNAIQK